MTYTRNCTHAFLVHWG